MIISFFEEFPTKNNIEKIKKISWKSKIYIAAESVSRFNRIIYSAPKNKNIIQYIYWPVLKKNEGYWISPFSKKEALIKVFLDIEKNGKDLPVMIDAELPFTRNPMLFITQIFNFSFNNRLIKAFFKGHKEVYSCEYYDNIKLKKNSKIN